MYAYCASIRQEAEAEKGAVQKRRRGWFDSLCDGLLVPTPVDTLCALRVGFGCIMVMQLQVWASVFDEFETTGILIKYPGFEWVRALHPATGRAALRIQTCLAYMVMLGWGTTWATRAACILFFWTFHQCERNHNNHYILIIHILLVASFVGWGKMYSLDSIIVPRIRKLMKWRDRYHHHNNNNNNVSRDFNDLLTVPFIQLLMLRLIFMVPYFFGGIAKLQGDWLLRQQPVRMWFEAFMRERSDETFLLATINHFWAPYMIAWGGCLFDLTEPLLMMMTPKYPALMPISFGGSLFFNCTNKWLLSIGVFPYAMVVSMVLFLPPGGVTYGVSLIREAITFMQPEKAPILIRPKNPRGRWRSGPRRYMVGALFSLWCLFHAVYPLRSKFLYPPFVSWHEEGHLGAWNMKLRAKECWATFQVSTGNEDDPDVVDFSPRYDPFLESKKARTLVQCHPYPALQYARYLQRMHEIAGRRVYKITMKSCASVNSRPWQRFFIEDVDVLQFVDTYWALGQTAIGNFVHQLQPLDKGTHDPKLACSSTLEPDATHPLRDSAAFDELYTEAGVVRKGDKIYIKSKKNGTGLLLLPLYYAMDNYNRFKGQLLVH